ncbi:MAG: hypothetical protein Q9219_000137 [cf. Caloplaca sp. 3 TL-2023]
MAILGNLQAFIAVGGSPRKEYVDEDLEMEHKNSVISKYIECQSGADFTLLMEINESFKFKSNAIVFKVYFDGHYVASKILNQYDLIPGTNHCLKLKEARKKINDRWEHRPFVFKEVKEDQEQRIVYKATHSYFLGCTTEPRAANYVTRSKDERNGRHSFCKPVPLEERPIESLSVQEMQELLRQHRQDRSRSANSDARTKLESTIAEQIKREWDPNYERPVKRERDDELDEILASAHVKKPGIVETIDLLDE